MSYHIWCVHYVLQVVQHPDAQNKAVGCGLFYNRTLWCGCGTYLVGLDPRDMLMKHYKRLVKEEDADISMMAASHNHVWVGFRDKSFLSVCSTVKPGDMEVLDCQ